MATKIWAKKEVENKNHSDKVEKFTVGNDKIYDLKLAKYDVEASLAHAKMLTSIGLLTSLEFDSILLALAEINKQIEANEFTIEEGVEDVHSQIEHQLTHLIGESGKKIHSGRSRNDQVLVAIKLFLRNEIQEIASICKKLFDKYQELSEKNKDILMPGYTHYQIAMPSSFGLWFGAYAESLVDDLEVLVAAFNVVNKNPLGSGAGFGSSFPLNRKMTTEILNFEDLNYNVVYAQMTRGKTEKIVAMALANIASTLSKFSYDVCLYMNQNFGFITFPDSLTTGSSIMPHKKNPDVFELIRAKCNKIQALPNELTLMFNNLASGYHRDSQLTKESLFPAISEIKNCLEMTHFMLEYIQINPEIINDKKYQYLFTVEEVNKLVLSGVPFREAYKEIGLSVENNTYSYETHLNHTHEGSIGNLCTKEIFDAFTKVFKQFKIL